MTGTLCSMPYVPLCFPFSMHFFFSLNHLSYLKWTKQTKYWKHRIVHYLQPHLWLLRITLNKCLKTGAFYDHFDRLGPYSDLNILPEGVLFKKIHVQEEQKRINIEIRRSTRLLQENASSCAGTMLIFSRQGQVLALLLGYTVPSQLDPEWQWVRCDMFWGGMVMVGTRRFSLSSAR